MFSKILVPLDGSELAELALPYAEELSEAFNSEIDLVEVCEKKDVRSAIYISSMSKGWRSY